MPVTVTRESFANLMIEAQELVRQHYVEISLHAEHKILLAPDLGKYLVLEIQGHLVTLVLRKPSGRIIGYWTMVTDTALHYRDCMTATMDLLYIDSQERTGANVLALMRSAERECHARGVRVWFGGEKLHAPIGKLWASLGFQKFELLWVKWLGGPDAIRR